MFELTIGEYEDAVALGRFATEDEALIALGRYALDHGDDGALHAYISESDDEDDECEGHESTDGPIGNVVYCDGTCRPRKADR